MTVPVPSEGHGRAVLRFEARLGTGEVLVREWTLEDPPPPWTKTPPAWGHNPSRSWGRPQDPITLRVDVSFANESAARQALDA